MKEDRLAADKWPDVTGVCSRCLWAADHDAEHGEWSGFIMFHLPED